MDHLYLQQLQQVPLELRGPPLLKLVAAVGHFFHVFSLHASFDDAPHVQLPFFFRVPLGFLLAKKKSKIYQTFYKYLFASLLALINFFLASIFTRS